MTEKKLLRKLTWNIFKRIALLQVIALVLASALALILIRSKVKSVAATQLVSETRFKIQTHLKYNKIDDDNFCSILDKDLAFIAIMKGSFKKVCIGDYLKDQKVSDIMYGHQKLNLKPAKIYYNKLIRKKALFDQSPITINGESYSLFLAFKPNKVVNFLLETNQAILFYIFPLLILTTLLSLYTSIKVATPLKSIITKIISFSDSYKQNNIMNDIDTKVQSEWEIIEKNIDDNEYKKRKLQKTLVKENNKFQALLDALSDSILAVDNDGKILFANNAFSTLFQGRFEQIEDTPYLDIIRNHELKSFIDGAISEGQSSFSSEFKIELSAGNTRDFYIKTNPLKDVKGRTYGIVCIFNDLTELKVAERMRVDFVTNVSHEIRTPLTAIKGYVQTLAAIMPELDDSKKEIMDTINHNCDRLTRLFNDVLSLSMIENMVEIETYQVDLEVLTTQSLRDISQIYNDANAIVNTTYEVKEINSNEKMLDHIVTNLVSNAYKYGGDNLQIDLAWSETANSTYLTISDNGVGIESKHLPRLFERFYRVDKSRVRDENGHEGTGLGLAIVKHIVHKMGGRISVESVVGKGTTFKIELPKRQLT
jgi:two-component system phosphate regulon sensor histidine kinase PhoR